MDENLVITDELLASTDNIFVGGSEDDLLLGNSENNELIGQGGNDTLDGASGNDLLRGGASNDSLLGNDGDDTLRGAADNDTLDGGSGNDSLIGGAGNDLLAGSIGNDILRGNDGNDTLNGSVGEDSLIGGAGNDLLVGSLGNDTLQGDEGDDTLIGGISPSISTGGAGADLFEIKEYGNSIVVTDFIDGVDLLQLPDGIRFSDLRVRNESDGSVGIRFAGDSGEDINTSGGGIFLQSITDVNQISEADFVGLSEEPDTVIVGTEGDDSLVGGVDNDSIYGLAGNDTLDGGVGNDTLIGGSGSNIFVLSLDGNTDELADYDPRNGDRIVLPEGVASSDLTINANNVDLIPEINLVGDETGADQQTIAILTDRLAIGLEAKAFRDADIRNTFITFEEFTGAGSPIEPTTDGIVGTDGNDSLVGTDGNDTLDGLAGNDTLDGGGGRNLLIGREGQNTYILRSDGNSDELIDYSPRNGDRIVLPAAITRDAVIIGGDENTFPIIQIDPIGFGPTSIATLSATIGLEAEGFTSQDIRNSLLTTEEFQANG